MTVSQSATSTKGASPGPAGASPRPSGSTVRAR